MPAGYVLSLQLSMMGRPVRSYVFGKPVIKVGRDPEADVFIDNPGISREHLRFERDADGDYEVIDLDSANGTLLNDLPVKCKIPLRNGDSVRIGKYSLTVNYAEDRRSGLRDQPRPAEAEHTMVLSREELNRVLEQQLKAEVKPPPPPPPPAAASRGNHVAARSTARASSGSTATIAGIVGFLLGTTVGAAAVWFVVR